MSKALKTVIAVGVSIAIPFVAPIIAQSAALAGITSSIGLTASSALVGAGLGATSAAVTGGDVGRGALMGGLGGGIGGYTAAPGAAPSQYAAPTAGPSQGISLPGATAGGGTGAGLSLPGAAPSLAGPVDYSLATAPAAAGAGLNATSVDAGLAATSPYTLTSGTAAMTPGLMASTAATPTAGVTTQPRTFTEAVQQIPGEIASRFRDPKALADMTLRAAGTLAGSALAGSGLSSQEQQLLNEQVAELRQLRETNQALFNQRLEQAQNLIGESKYFDPEYFGLQRARRAQIAGAKAKQAGLRGLTGERAQAEARRFDIATGRETGTAFDVGYQSGIQGRLGTMQAGLQAMPGPMQMSPYTSVQHTLSEAERRRRERAGDIGSLFGSLTGAGQSRSRGPGGGG